MSIIEITKFMTGDGRTFMTFEEAQIHSESLFIDRRIDSYLNALVDKSPLSKSRAGNAIRQFLIWESNEDEPLPDAGD